jgi:WD40 repeat protein
LLCASDGQQDDQNDSRTPSSPFPWHTSISCLAFSPDSATVVSGSYDGVIALWDVRTRQIRRILLGRLADMPADFGPAITAPPLAIEALRFSPDGETLAVGTSEASVRFWAVKTSQRMLDLKVTPPKNGFASVISLSYRPDGQMLAAGQKNFNWKHTGMRSGAVVWNCPSETELGRYDSSFTSPVVAFLGRGETLALMNGRTVSVFDTGSGHELFTMAKATAGSLSSMAVSPDGSLLAAGEADDAAGGAHSSCSIIVWSLDTHKIIAELKGHEAAITDVAFAPDGKLLVSASDDGSVRLWDVSAQQARAVLREHQGRVQAVAYAPDGRTLVSGGEDQTVRFWNVAEVLQGSSGGGIPGGLGTSVTALPR